MSKLICLLAVVAALTVLGMPLPHPLGMGRLSGVLDFGHCVLFASLTFCFFWLLKSRAWPACGLAVALAALSEAGQSLVGRTASVQDALLGMLGALSALIILLAVRRPWSMQRIVGATAAVLALAAWPVARAIPYALDAWSEYRQFPVLCDFQSPWQGRRWLTPGAVIRTVPGGRGGETSVGEVDFPGAQNHTGTIVLKPLIGEWSGYRRLCCEFSFDGDPIKVSALLQTGEEACTAQARCLDRVFAAGDHCVSIDLPLSQDYGAGQLDLSRVRSLCFRFAGLKGPRTLLLHKVFLASPRNAAAGALVHRISAPTTEGAFAESIDSQTKDRAWESPSIEAPLRLCRIPRNRRRHLNVRRSPSSGKSERATDESTPTTPASSRTLAERTPIPHPGQAAVHLPSATTGACAWIRSGAPLCCPA